MTEPTEPTAPSGVGSTRPTDDDTAAVTAVAAAAGRPAGTAAVEPPPKAGRRLDRAPSDRFGRGRRGREATVVADDEGSPTRAVAMGSIGASIGVVIFLVLAIGFSYTAGLLFVAIFTGRFIGLFVRAGAAGALSSPARVALSVVIFLVAMTIATLGTWLAAGLEGGILPLGDYLEQAYGTPLISLEFMLGTLMAWWSSR